MNITAGTAESAANQQVRATRAPLSPIERTRLGELEAVIERGRDAFLEVGRALVEVRDSKLYREAFETFEHYLRVRWDMSRSRGYQLIDAAAVSTVVDIGNEAQARALAPVRDLDLEPWSVDAIVTDPPYAREQVPLYGALAEVTARVLKPGGSLAVLCGQVSGFDVYPLLAAKLDYRRTLSYTLAGHRARTWSPRVLVNWKPVLWFQNGGPLPETFIEDAVTSPSGDKRFHPWQQSEGGTAALVETFSRPRDLVLDPFLGSGTTGVAALRLGRRFIGCDVSADTVRLVRARLASAVEDVARGA